ncbi:MAG: hypothetical protein ABWY82_08235 [Tardiphaga sp.]
MAKKLALPREAREIRAFKSLAESLGESNPIERQGFSRAAPKPIRADLTGSNQCCAVNIMARGYSPVLALCRKLIAADHDPSRRLQIYRGETLCLTVRSIGEGARLTVQDNRHGTPTLYRLRLPGVGTAPPMRSTHD